MLKFNLNITAPTIAAIEEALKTRQSALKLTPIQILRLTVKSKSCGCRSLQIEYEERAGVGDIVLNFGTFKLVINNEYLSYVNNCTLHLNDCGKNIGLHLFMFNEPIFEDNCSHSK